MIYQHVCYDIIQNLYVSNNTITDLSEKLYDLSADVEVIKQEMTGKVLQ
jgi:hypothetical protein